MRTRRPATSRTSYTAVPGKDGSGVHTGARLSAPGSPRRKSVESSSAPNAIDGAGQAIQVRADTPGTWRDAIDTPNDSLPHVADATEAGYMLIGDNDVSVEVTGADTYEFQWNDAEVDGSSLTFYDVQTYLIVEYD